MKSSTHKPTPQYCSASSGISASRRQTCRHTFRHNTLGGVCGVGVYGVDVGVYGVDIGVYGVGVGVGVGVDVGVDVDVFTNTAI